MKNYVTLHDKLTLVGVLFGLAFPVTSVLVDLLVRDMSFSLNNIASLYEVNKIQWIVLMAPFVLGFILNYFGKFTARREKLFKDQLANATGQFQIVEDAISNLEARDFKITNNTNYVVANETSHLIEVVEKFKTKFYNDRDLERQRQWSMEGLTELNEIITSKQKIEKLADLTLHFVVKYLNCIQGSLFLTREEEGKMYLGLAACYAYDRKKFGEKRIEIGDGVVGQCFLEKSRITMTNVPHGYVKITSGLGESTPTSLNVVPLLYDGAVEGVIEIAGFKKLLPHELHFLDKAAENIGNIFSNVKRNERTEELWQAAQSQAQQMKEQEEEMRQSLEELTAIQEEMERKEQEYINKIQELENQKTEFERLEWENKHKIQAMRRLLSEKSIEYSDASVEEFKNEQRF